MHSFKNMKANLIHNRAQRLTPYNTDMKSFVLKYTTFFAFLFDFLSQKCLWTVDTKGFFQLFILLMKQHIRKGTTCTSHTMNYICGEFCRLLPPSSTWKPWQKVTISKHGSPLSVAHTHNVQRKENSQSIN